VLKHVITLKYDQLSLYIHYFIEFQRLLNTIETMRLDNTEIEFQSKLTEIFSSFFSDIPSIQGWELLENLPTNANIARADAVVEVRFKDCTIRLLIEIKSLGQPKQARHAVNQLRTISSQEVRSYPVFIAPYISPATAELCRKSDIGYADFAGNCRLAFNDVYIFREGCSNPYISKRKLKSLYQPAASRVLRVLLANSKKAWKVAQLQQEANVSIGTVSNVRNALLDREWIQKGIDGIQLSDPGSLLNDWSNHYSFRKNTIYDFYSLKSIAEIENEIADQGVQYALTAFSAAARWAPSVRSNRVFAYISKDIEVLAEKLNLKSVPSGANVTLLKPYDDGVYYGSEMMNDVRIVAPIQTYLDLMSLRGRGEEAAQHLLENVIQQQW